MAALSHIAGIFRWHTSIEDSLRAEALNASLARDLLEDSAASPGEHLRNLSVRLQYHVGTRDRLVRVAALVRKTNQFNLSLLQMNEAEIALRAEQHPSNVIAIELADRHSNSGIVAAVVGEYGDGVLQAQELSVRCRALGWPLEDRMLIQALLLMVE